MVNRAADDDDSVKGKASGGTTETKAPTTRGADADPALPQCSDDEDDGGAYASEDEGQQMDDVRLERQSSFVVSFFFWSMRRLYSSEYEYRDGHVAWCAG